MYMYVYCCMAGSLLQLLNGPVANVAKSSTELVTWKYAFLVGSGECPHNNLKMTALRSTLVHIFNLHSAYCNILR